MNSLELNIKNIQHIQSLECNFDLSSYGLHCIVGKNGVGKTTLIKILQNFKETNFLDKISRLNIINKNSEIKYTFNDIQYSFTAQQIGNKYILDSNDSLPQDVQENIFTELPFPSGKRFSEFAKLGEIGNDVQAKFALEKYEDCEELISIFSEVYQKNKFDNLKQITIKQKKYYFIPLNQENYLREDNFSSGEYMIVQIYKLIQNKSKLIVIDELDISLDAAAQVRFIKALSKLATQYEVNFLFTVHSLAIMKLFSEDDLNGSLYYMETDGKQTTIEKRSYNFIKAELFQFVGYDKIILTEDKMLKSYMEYIIDFPIDPKYAIIDIAGASQTVDLMGKSNSQDLFNGAKVLTVLDADQQREYSQADINFIPFESIEKDFYSNYFSYYQRKINADSIERAKGIGKKSKAFYHEIIDRNILTKNDIFDKLNSLKSTEFQTFKNDLKDFFNA